MTRRRGKELIAQMNALHVPAGAFALWWLGQMGVAVKGPDQQVVYIDPCLTDIVNLKWPDPTRGPTRAIEAPLQPEDVTNASVVICSHEHIDHTDCFTLAGIAQASPHARFVATGWAQHELDAANIPHERRIIPHPQRTVDLGVLTLTIVPAAHYTREYDVHHGERWMSLHLDWGTVAFSTVVIPCCTTGTSMPSKRYRRPMWACWRVMVVTPCVMPTTLWATCTHTRPPTPPKHWAGIRSSPATMTCLRAIDCLPAKCLVPSNALLPSCRCMHSNQVSCFSTYANPATSVIPRRCLRDRSHNTTTHAVPRPVS